jgi:predicted DCC family thiol-disulfide oxidoreductase YuxK
VTGTQLGFDLYCTDQRKANLEMERPADSNRFPVLLYDGVCAVCNKSVQTILKHDRQGTMRFAALQSDYGAAALERHPDLKGVDSVIFLEPAADNGNERAYARSTAALKVASYLGGIWKFFFVAYILPKPLRDALYDFVARNRYKVFGKHESCMLPPPNSRARFLDVV